MSLLGSRWVSGIGKPLPQRGVESELGGLGHTSADADLTEASLNGANFERPNLHDTDLHAIHRHNPGQLAVAIVDDSSRLPDS